MARHRQLRARANRTQNLQRLMALSQTVHCPHAQNDFRQFSRLLPKTAPRVGKGRKDRRPKLREGARRELGLRAADRDPLCRGARAWPRQTRRLTKEEEPKKKWDFGPGGRSESHLRPDPFQPLKEVRCAKQLFSRGSYKKQARQRRGRRRANLVDLQGKTLKREEHNVKAIYSIGALRLANQARSLYLTDKLQ